MAFGIVVVCLPTTCPPKGSSVRSVCVSPMVVVEGVGRAGSPSFPRSTLGASFINWALAEGESELQARSKSVELSLGGAEALVDG